MVDDAHEVRLAETDPKLDVVRGSCAGSIAAHGRAHGLASITRVVRWWDAVAERRRLPVIESAPPAKDGGGEGDGGVGRANDDEDATAVAMGRLRDRRDLRGVAATRLRRRQRSPSRVTLALRERRRRRTRCTSRSPRCRRGALSLERDADGPAMIAVRAQRVRRRPPRRSVRRRHRTARGRALGRRVTALIALAVAWRVLAEGGSGAVCRCSCPRDRRRFRWLGRPFRIAKTRQKSGLNACVTRSIEGRVEHSYPTCYPAVRCSACAPHRSVLGEKRSRTSTRSWSTTRTAR